MPVQGGAQRGHLGGGVLGGRRGRRSREGEGAAAGEPVASATANAPPPAATAVISSPAVHRRRPRPEDPRPKRLSPAGPPPVRPPRPGHPRPGRLPPGKHCPRLMRRSGIGAGARHGVGRGRRVIRTEAFLHVRHGAEIAAPAGIPASASCENPWNAGRWPSWLARVWPAVLLGRTEASAVRRRRRRPCGGPPPVEIARNPQMDGRARAGRGAQPDVPAVRGRDRLDDGQAEAASGRRAGLCRRPPAGRRGPRRPWDRGGSGRMPGPRPARTCPGPRRRPRARRRRRPGRPGR